MKRLGIFPLVVLLTLSGLSNGDPGIGQDDGTQNLCPEYCRCEQAPGAGMTIRCDRITPTQRFDDHLTSFYLERGEQDTSEGLTMTKKFFMNLGAGFKNVDSITIDVDITSIDRDAFEGLNGLTYVNLTNNNLKYIHPDTFTNNTHLKQLSLSKNPLKFDGVFLNIPDLRELDLSYCQLYNLTPNAFEKLSEVIYINLESNYIADINPKTFEGLTRLEELKLSNNNIRELSPDVFLKNEALNVIRLNHNPLTSVENIKLPSVTHLDLKHCGFTKLTSTSFDGFDQVLNLNLSGNLITELSSDTFSKLSHLLYLDLSNNKLGPLDDKLFVENRELETLSLRDNPSMKVWPERGFQGQFQDLYRLDISNTGIQTLALSSLKNMSNLAQLDLSSNSLKGFDVGVIPRKLRYLSMTFNNITSINDLNFPKESQMRHLFLQGNQIKHLDRSNFDNLPYLARLDLSSCGLETIWADAHPEIEYVTKLRQLNLSKNKLRTILPTDLDVFSQLDMLDIRGNPFKCDDDLRTLLKYLHESPVEPIASSDVGNIDENFETFLWEEIWTQNCKGQPNLPTKPNEQLIEEGNKRQTVRPPKVHTVTVNELEPVSYDNSDYEDIIDIDNMDPDYDQYEYDHTKSPHKLEPTPDIVQESNTSPYLIVFLSALVVTLVISLMIALVATLCKHKTLFREKGVRKLGHRGGSLSYKPLHENEHHNIPTTPIVKTKTVSTVNGDAGTGANGYNRKAGPNATYLSSDFHHSNITPETV